MTTAVVICPGRGTYNAGELGYLSRHFPHARLLQEFDSIRTSMGQETLTALDTAERFSLAKHTRGDNASGLIFAATLGDFLSIDREKIEIVGITGNSMGWYSALACAGAVSHTEGFQISNGMGTLMQEAMIGGQVVYPWMNDDWTANPDRRAELLAVVVEIDGRADHTLSLSIDLGGMLVLAGNLKGLEAFEAAVPLLQDRFPMRLKNHAGFHSSMQKPVSLKGYSTYTEALFKQPSLPMIDGRGKVWWPSASNLTELHDYTFGHQVTATYDFTKAIQMAAREFSPDLFIVTGPGTTLGGAVIQSLLLDKWLGMIDRDSFKSVQEDTNLLISMGREDQRSDVTT